MPITKSYCIIKALCTVMWCSTGIMVVNFSMTGGTAYIMRLRRSGESVYSHFFLVWKKKSEPLRNYPYRQHDIEGSYISEWLHLYPHKRLKQAHMILPLHNFQSTSGFPSRFLSGNNSMTTRLLQQVV